MNKALTIEDDDRRIWLRVGEIVEHSERNTRCYTEGSGVLVSGSADVGDELTDAELAADIRERGLIAPLGVTLTNGGIYRLRWGYRRHRACMSISEDLRVPCILVDETDAWAELSDNLAENLHRKQLQTFEVADALFRMRQLRPDLPQTSLCDELRISKGYGSQLLTIREKACPELWRLFVEYGTRFSRNVSVRHLYAIAKLPKGEQLAAWDRLIAERDKGTDRKKRKQGGLVRRAEVLRWLSHVTTLPESEAFREGARFALRCVLRMQRWEVTPDGTRPTLKPRRPPQPPPPPQENHAIDHP